MTRDEIYRAYRLSRIDADVPLPQFCGCQIEFEGIVVNRMKLRQIVESASRLRTLGVEQ